MKKRKALTPTKSAAFEAEPLLGELRQLIDAARQRVATSANVELTMLYWRIGARIRSEILKNQRAE